MGITLKRLYEYRLEDFELMAKWDNDDEIRHFICVNTEEKELEQEKAEDLLERARGNSGKYIYFVMKDTQPIGTVSIMDKFEHLTFKDDKTAWISICIGEKQYWGTGAAKEAMTLLEEECRAMGYDKIELGVFAFNPRAAALYRKLGYKEININHNFTYYDGKWQDDIRMLKNI